MVDGLGADVRILTGSAAVRPPGAAPAAVARKWSSNPPPYHDRLWILDGRSGLSVGTSVNGLQGQRAYRVAELDPHEVAEWSAAFETWWRSSSAQPL